MRERREERGREGREEKGGVRKRREEKGRGR